MDDSNLRCSICGEKYGEERVPKNLGCGHCLCDSCAEEILGRDKTCPECQTRVSAPFASDLVINYPLLRLIRALATTDVLPSDNSSSVGSVPDEREVPPTPYQDIKPGCCDIHNAEVNYRCMRCCKWLCKDCWSAFHAEPARGNCKVVPLDKALEELKTSFIDRAGSKFESAKQIKLSIDLEVSSLITAIEQHKKNAHLLNSTLEEVENNFSSLETRLESQKKSAMEKHSVIHDAIEIMQGMSNSVKYAKTIHERLNAIEGANAVLESVETNLVQEQHRPTPALPKFLSQGKYNLQGMLEAGKQIYTTCEVKGRHCFAQVTSKDGMLYLHALGEGAHATSGVCIPYKTVRRLVPLESPTVFLDVNLAGNFIGRVHIRMFGNTPRSRQTMFLCSGEEGPSYKCTCFYRLDRKGTPLEILRGGDYEKNNGSGGKGIMPGITSGGVYRTEIVAGLLVGWPADEEWHLGTFDIYLRQSPGVYDHSGHGIVTSGLDILRSVARHSPMKNSMIQDCGVVIHL